MSANARSSLGWMGGNSNKNVNAHDLSCASSLCEKQTEAYYRIRSNADRFSRVEERFSERSLRTATDQLSMGQTKFVPQQPYLPLSERSLRTATDQLSMGQTKFVPQQPYLPHRKVPEKMSDIAFFRSIPLYIAQLCVRNVKWDASPSLLLSSSLPY